MHNKIDGSDGGQVPASGPRGGTLVAVCRQGAREHPESSGECRVMIGGGHANSADGDRDRRGDIPSTLRRAEPTTAPGARSMLWAWVAWSKIAACEASRCATRKSSAAIADFAFRTPAGKAIPAPAGRGPGPIASTRTIEAGQLGDRGSQRGDHAVRASSAICLSTWRSTPVERTRCRNGSRSAVRPCCSSRPSGSQPTQRHSPSGAPKSLVA